MNTKTSLKRSHNYYDGSEHGMGRDSPGALLDMLAEVASQTLHSEKKRDESIGVAKPKSKAESAKRKTQETFYTSSQLLSMPATQLVKQFSIFTSDELKRQYSYTCALVPGCGQRYTSFASEGRARMSIKAHLAEHLEYLKGDNEAYTTFTATAVKNRSAKSSPPNKKVRVQQPKKPQETLNKENKEVKPDKSTNYLRKILSNEMNFKDFEKQKTLEKQKTKEVSTAETKIEPDDAEVTVLGDHSYYEQVKVDSQDGKVTPDLGEMMVDEAMEENIMLMVVESDGVHMKELPCIAQEVAVHTNQQDSETIYLPETVAWSEEGFTDMVEMAAPKPKGKAKFIGTSKEEREMALALMDRIKKKGNPTGGNLQCRICDPPRSFTAPTTLVSHYRSHAGIKPYECRICRAVFTRRHSLKYHMLIHQNQTRFTCADCGKKFRHPSHFREHRRRHTGESPFGCADCGQRFKTRNTYKRHLKTRHGKLLTTTGELLNLSEEDFQKVRTNPKRRQENVVQESMADEDLTATETIMQYQNGDSNDNEENQIAYDDPTEDYPVQSEETEDDSSNGVTEWTNGESVAVKEENYKDIEYWEECPEDKTDYIETEIAVENCEFANAEDETSQLQYEEVEYEQQEEAVSESITVVGHSNEEDIQIEQSEEHEVVYQENLQDEQNVLLYEEDAHVEDCNEVEYHESVQIVEEDHDNLEYNGDEQDENNEVEIGVMKEENLVNYFDEESNGHSEVHYQETVEISEEDQEIKSEYFEEIELAQIDTSSQNEVEVQNNIQQYQIQVVPEQRMDHPQKEITQQNGVLVVRNKGASILQQKGMKKNQHQKKHLLKDQVATPQLVQRKTPALLRKDVAQKQNQKKYILQELSADSQQAVQPNVTVERIIEYPNTATYESQQIQMADNVQHVYLQGSQTNSIVIQNKDLANLLSHRIKLSRQQSHQNLQLSQNGKIVTLFNRQPQAFNLVQNGKQGAILLVANNELKSNFLQLDQNNIVVNGMKTLPVVTVQQKINQG